MPFELKRCVFRRNLFDSATKIWYNTIKGEKYMTYNRRVQYYETDKMQCTHHSNYIRFMEEARLDFLDKIGYGYARMEKEGLISPVISVEVQYKKPTTFDDIICIEVALKSMTLAKMEFGYTMTCRGEVVCLAKSEHCFLNKDNRPVSIKKVNPTLFDLLCSKIE